MLLQVLGKLGTKSGTVILNPRLEAIFGPPTGLPKKRNIASLSSEGSNVETRRTVEALLASNDDADKRTSDPTPKGGNDTLRSRKKGNDTLRCRKGENDTLRCRKGENTSFRGKKQKTSSSAEADDTAQLEVSDAGELVEESAIPKQMTEPTSEINFGDCPELNIELEKPTLTFEDYYLNDYSCDEFFETSLPEDLDFF
jgi:hypothetical protein